MKKLILLAGLIIGTMAFAQAPQQMSYQAVIRNASGQLVQNQDVAVKASIVKDSPDGTVVYSERLTGTTNANGLLSTAIGSGTILSGDFTTIDWSSGSYFLKTETDPAGGTSYSITGTSQLLSVPYAMLAKGITLPFKNISNTYQTLFDIENTYNSTDPVMRLKGRGSYSSSSILKVENEGFGSAIYARGEFPIEAWTTADNGGIAIQGYATGNSGIGISGVAFSDSNDNVAVSGYVAPPTGKGRVARFVNYSSSNYINVFEVESYSTANLAVFRNTGSNVARINAVGKGFFNGGTQNSGADIAEAFDVEGNPEHYEPGDILVISTKTDRSVEKSSEPYSTLVAGVYATKPGVLLTEENIDSDLEGKVPMGVIGVIPTKVCLEGGTIKRGDLLVTSSISGVAMKADSDKVKVGQVLGKALQDFNGNGIGKINVLVSVK